MQILDSFINIASVNFEALFSNSQYVILAPDNMSSAVGLFFYIRCSRFSLQTSRVCAHYISEVFLSRSHSFAGVVISRLSKCLLSWIWSGSNLFMQHFKSGPIFAHIISSDNFILGKIIWIRFLWEHAHTRNNVLDICARHDNINLNL